MRTDPDIKLKKHKESYFLIFKKWLAIIICFITVYFFLFKIVFF